MLYEFVQLPVSNNWATLLNCTVRESRINVRVPKYGPRVPRKGIGSPFPHIGPRVLVLRWRVPGMGFPVLVPCTGPGSRVPGPGSHFSGMLFFYQKLIVLNQGDNNFLFYFDICIKFTLSTIILTMKKW